jgi:anti-sigma-K factor RskA
MNELNEEQLLDLLCKQAVTGLDSSELEQMKALEKSFPEWADDDSFEIAAAAINVSGLGDIDPMPAHLRSIIVADSAKFFDAQEESIQPTFGFAPKKSVWQSLGWGVAALACIALAVNVYLTRLQPQNNQAILIPQVTQSPTPKPDVSQQFAQFLASDPNVIKAEVAKADPKSPVEITGDIVWSAEKQEGFMRFRGLPANDPTKSTYQLWIFDEAQDEKYPVDGGVFDVNNDGEVIIPIDAKINVKNPKLFAVTKEKPGGVVVSDRKGIIAVAKV